MLLIGRGSISRIAPSSSEIASRRGAADTIRLDWSEPSDEQRWPADPGERTRTRLGLDDRLVGLSETWTSPFGQVIVQMKIPGWMVKNPEDHEENARIIDRTSTELRFHWGSGDFVYNRHGLDFAEDAGGGPSSPVRKGEKEAGVSYRNRITIEPGKRGGKPCIGGMRITVYDVLEYLASGMSEQEILDDFPDLTRDDIRACLSFAADRERKLVSLGES